MVLVLWGVTGSGKEKQLLGKNVLMGSSGEKLTVGSCLVQGEAPEKWCGSYSLLFVKKGHLQVGCGKDL